MTSQTQPLLNVPANRAAQKYTWSETFRRLAWGVGQWAFRLSPRPCFGWRRFVLRSFGATIGNEVHTYPSTRIYFPWNLAVGDWSAIGEEALIYNLGRVTIGERVTISHRAHLCAGSHDYSRWEFALLKPPIQVGSGAWICADAFIGPGVRVGEGAIVAARGVAISDVEPWVIVAGNPARGVKKREIPVR